MRAVRSDCAEAVPEIGLPRTAICRGNSAVPPDTGPDLSRLSMAAEDRLTAAITCNIDYEREQNNGKRSSCCFQRWCHCNHHHYYGAGIEGAARHRLGGTRVSASAFRQLRLELHLSGDLLEQPPPSSSHCGTGRWPHPLGQFILIVLPIPHSGCDGLDG